MRLAVARELSRAIRCVKLSLGIFELISPDFEMSIPPFSSFLLLFSSFSLFVSVPGSQKEERWEKEKEARRFLEEFGEARLIFSRTSTTSYSAFENSQVQVIRTES